MECEALIVDELGANEETLVPRNVARVLSRTPIVADGKTTNIINKGVLLDVRNLTAV